MIQNVVVTLDIFTKWKTIQTIIPWQQVRTWNSLLLGDIWAYSLFAGDKHLSGIMRDGSEDSDTGMDDKNRPDNALQSEERVDSSVTDNVNNGDGNSSSTHHNDPIDASKQGTSDTTNLAATLPS